MVIDVKKNCNLFTFPVRDFLKIGPRALRLHPSFRIQPLRPLYLFKTKLGNSSSKFATSFLSQSGTSEDRSKSTSCSSLLRISANVASLSIKIELDNHNSDLNQIWLLSCCYQTSNPLTNEQSLIIS